MSEKRDVHIAIVSDLHCGAYSGLTPARYISDDFPSYSRPMWTWFKKEAAACGKLDLLVCNGDAVDGEGKKDSLGLFCTDTKKQGAIAAECLRAFDANTYKLTYGTPYHTVGSWSYEEAVADAVQGEIEDTLFLEINGVRFSIRHVVGTSGTPYGQPTMLGKALVNDLIQAIAGGQESADWVIRSHAHLQCEVGIDGRKARITPCLQAPDGVLGRKLTTWYYHIGFLEMTVKADGRVVETPHMLPLDIVRRREWVRV